MITRAPKQSNLTQWIVLVMVSVILGSLLIIKFTGRQDIFSYQGVRPSTPGFGSYASGISAINSRLKSGSGSIGSSLKQGVDLLQQSYHSTKDKSLLNMLSGELKKAQSIQLIAQAQSCFDTLQTGFNAMGGIVREYQDLLVNYQTVTSEFSKAIVVLPNSTTKECLLSYAGNLQNSFESIVLAYKNIDSLSKSLNGLIASYSQTLGDCSSLSDIVGRLVSFEANMEEVNRVLVEVKRNLETHDIDSYNKLCSYGSVQGLTGLQIQSRNIVQMVDALPKAQLEKVDDLNEYIKKLKSQTTTSGTKSRFENLLHK